MAADFETVLALAAEVMRSPSFPKAEVELERRQILQGIKSMKEQPFSMAYNYLREALYPGHPYGLSQAQTERCMAAFTQGDLQAAHCQYFRPDNIVISLAGRLSPAVAVNLIEKFFGDWQRPDEPLPAVSLPEVAVAAQRIVTAQETNQAFIVLGHLAGAVSDPDYAALKAD